MFRDTTYKPRPKYHSVYHANIRDKQSALKRLRSAYHKTKVELHVDGDECAISASLVLGEVSAKGAYVFTRAKLRKRSALTFRIQAPLQISVRGNVRYSEVFASETGVQALKLEPIYRTYVEFTLNSEVEREALEDLYLKVRDESYAATRWHRYRNELAQREIRARHQAERMQEQVRALQEEPVLATEDLLVSSLRVPVAG